MKKITFTALLFFIITGAFAQVATTYGFSQSTTTYAEITGGTVLGDSANDDEVFNNTTVAAAGPLTGTGFPIGFNFVYNEVTYDKFAVNINGWIKFGTETFTIGASQVPLSGSTANVNTLVSAMGTDIVGQAGSELSYLTIGTAPNRKLVVQWKGYKRFNEVAGAESNINFQIVLNETSNRIDFIYGTNTLTTQNANYTVQVGIKAGSNAIATNVKNRLTTTDWSATTAGTTNASTLALTPTVAPASGLVFSWQMLPLCTGTPDGGTPTTAITRTVCTGIAPGVITVTGATALTPGISYQWEESTDDGATWINATAGTNPTTLSYTPPVFAGVTILYRLKVQCAGGSAGYSAITTVSGQQGPVTQASGLTISSSYTAMTVAFTAGNGARRMVIVSDTPIADPVDESGIAAPPVAAAYAGGQQIVYDGTGATVNVTGLSCNTTYYVKVYDYNRCGVAGAYDYFYNVSTGTNAATVTSPAAVSLPQQNNFTGFTGANLGAVAPGWFESTIVTVAGNTPTTENPAGITSTWANSAVFSIPTAKINLVGRIKNDWIISPKLTITAASRIKFKAAITDAASAAADVDGMVPTDDAVLVLISTDGCGATWTPLYTFDANTTTSLTNVLTDYSLPIAGSYIGQTVQIAFQAYDGPTDDAPSYDFHIGNIIIETTPACDTPVALPAASAITSVTENGATITWGAPLTGTPSGYQYVVSTTNVAPTAPGTGNTGTSVVIGGLPSSTEHFVFVRSVCGAAFGNWILAATFKTLCDAPEVLTTVPGGRCNAGTLDISATATPGATLMWYAAQTGGAPLHIGPTYSPSVAATTTYYVSASSGATAGASGKPAPPASATGFNTENGWGIIVDAIEPVNLTSVDIYSTSAGTINIAIMSSATGTELYETGNVAIAGGGTSVPNVVPLNFSLPAGTGYKITIKDLDGVSLIRDLSGAVYPYNGTDGKLNVTSSYTTSNSFTTYYWFYNILYSTGCSSARTAVTASVTTGANTPTGATSQTISANSAAEATIEDIVVAETGVKWYASQANAIAGVSALAAGTQVTAGTVYYGTLATGSCTPLAVTITQVLGSKGFDIASFTYYPNPVKDVLNLSSASAITSVSVYNLLGQKVLVKEINSEEAKIDMATLAEGTYIVNVTTGESVKTIKVVKK